MTLSFRPLHWENKSCQNISDVYRGQRTRSLLIRWSGIKNIWLIISTFQWQQVVSDNKRTQLQNKSIRRSTASKDPSLSCSFWLSLFILLFHPLFSPLFSPTSSLFFFFSFSPSLVLYFPPFLFCSLSLASFSVSLFSFTCVVFYSSYKKSRTFCKI